MTTGRIYPEFTVQCTMCETSFSATADHLKELVAIVELHLREAKNLEHKEFITKHGESDYPKSHFDILSSPYFMWGINRLVPFNKIFELFKVHPTPTLEIVLAP